MNEIFSFNRFFKLLKKELAERAPMIVKMAGIFSLLLVGFLLNIIIFGRLSAEWERAAYVLSATYITMVLAPFNLYKSYNHPKKGIDYVLLPASVTEKYLSMLVNTVIVLPLVTFFSILLVDTIITTFSPSSFSGYAINPFINTPRALIFKSIAKALILQQGFIFGNFLFKKSKIIKTIFSGIGLFIAFGFLILFFLVLAFKGEAVPLENNMNQHIILNLNNGGFTGSLQGLIRYFATLIDYAHYMNGTNPVLDIFRYCHAFISYVLPVVFLTGTFYKMKTQKY